MLPSDPSAVPTSDHGQALAQRAASLRRSDPDWPPAMEAAVSHWTPMALRLSRPYRGRVREPDDLEQVALTALVQAVARYRPELGDFLPYAIPTIAGEIRRWLRDGTRLVRVPRRLLELDARVRISEEQLTQDLGRPATDAEVAENVGVTPDDVVQARTGRAARWPVAVAGPLPAELGPSGLDPGVEQVERRRDARQHLARLDPRRKRLLYLRFFGGWSQARIAEDLGVSQVQVSRLLAATLSTLHHQVTGEGDPQPPRDGRRDR